MKILLVGEYSRLHNSLKEGLIALGHEVTLIGDGDSFKNFPVDFSIKPKIVNSSWFSRKAKVGFYKLSKVDLGKVESAIRFLRIRKKLKGYDVVQFINSNALKMNFSFQKKQIQYLKKHNKKMFLLVCGNDYPVVKFLLKNNLKYSLLTPFFAKEATKEDYKFLLEAVTPEYEQYYTEVEEYFEKLIPADIDYVIPLKDHPKSTELIPTPINIDKLTPAQISTDFQNQKIHIFHGINEGSSIRKGNHFFEKALLQIEEKFGDKVKITTVKSLPYDEYIKIYDTAHILLDMVYAYDQGYNALEAMAKGKVVFTGAETEFLEHYKLQEDEVCINALPDVDYLVEKLSWLIENPSEIERIGKNAQEFVKREHHYVSIAKKYVKVWNAN